MFIESGLGGGFTAGVDSSGRLIVSSKSSSNAAIVAKSTGLCFSWTAAKDIDATDTILLLCNNSTTKRLYIDALAIGSDVTTQFTMFSPAYPTLAGDEIIGLNSDRSSGNVAEASAYQDETGNTQANVMTHGFIPANTTAGINVEGRIILGYHDCIAIDIVAEPTMAVCTIVGYFE